MKIKINCSKPEERQGETIIREAQHVASFEIILREGMVLDAEGQIMLRERIRIVAFDYGIAGGEMVTATLEVID